MLFFGLRLSLLVLNLLNGKYVWLVFEVSLTCCKDMAKLMQFATLVVKLVANVLLVCKGMRLYQMGLQRLHLTVRGDL